MVTPEMLLFLAGKMGLPNPVAELGECCYVEAQGVWRVFNPATDDAQFGRLVVWVIAEGLDVALNNPAEIMWSDGTTWFSVQHDSTPDSIRAAAVVAVCRALGFDAAMEADNVPE